MININQQFTEPMIFVTGASRSGTTMLSRMLNQHSSVSDLRELHCFGDLSDSSNLRESMGKKQAVDLSAQLIARSKRDVWGTVIDEDKMEAEQLWQRAAEDNPPTGKVISSTLSFLAARQGKAIPCEQTPRNIFYAGDLLQSYPNLRIVHIVRDPRDVLASQKNRWKRRRLGGDNIPFSEIIRVWCNYHPYTISKLWARATRLALHYKAQERFYLLRFEDLVENPESEVQKMCGFLGLPYESAMLDIPQVGSSHRNNAEQQSGITKSSLNRWVDVLSSGEVFVCEKMTSSLMKKFSYSPVSSDSPISLSDIMQLLKFPIHAAGVLFTNPRRAWIQFQAVMGKSK
ncbi:MAG: sulfotransferase [Candidatus Thiodiazotropha sp. (ex Ustalcina ferruginea)]|nr:sulfotransferase [Candidatus Thiodiazotropha sp. (ex Ustalcina ferruginea)]